MLFFGLEVIESSKRGVNVNHVLPKEKQLKKRHKYVDGIAKAVIPIRGSTLYNVLEVVDKGYVEDTVVRVQLIIDWVDRILIVAESQTLCKLEEQLKALCPKTAGKILFRTPQQFGKDLMKLWQDLSRIRLYICPDGV